MNCSECFELMTELTRPVPIEASRRDGAFKHLEGCASCSSRFTLELEMQKNLEALRDEDSRLQGPDRVRNNLVAAFRQQQEVQVAHTGRINGSVRVAIGAAAAVLLALIGYAFWNGVQADKQSKPDIVASTPVPNVTLEEPAQTQVAKIFGSAEQMRLSSDKSKKGKNRTRSEKPEKPASAPVGNVSYELGEFKPITPRAEVATDFIPLVAARGLPPSDSGQVIRVSMPRSAMAYFGLPVPLEPPGKQVQADVLVADDGLARAIRFVR